MKSLSSDSPSPLSAATFHVLLALAAQDLHGYGIIQEVIQISGGKYRIGPGTLYDNLKKLLNGGWVEDYQEECTSEDEPRRMYRLTKDGRAALEADVRRMKRVLRFADRRLAGKGRA
jgi:PadR family transcriptional regulator PadR